MASRAFDFYNKTYKSYPDLTLARAKEIGDKIGVDWSKFDLGEFRQGVKEEMEHGSEYGDATKVHDDSYETAGRIALAHLIEVADYYQRLEQLENAAEDEWGEGDEEAQKRAEWVKSNYADEAAALEAEGIKLEDLGVAA